MSCAAERVVSNLSQYGNTSAASIPLALDEAVRRGDIKPGEASAFACQIDPFRWRLYGGGVRPFCMCTEAQTTSWLSFRPAALFSLPLQVLAMAGFGAGLTWASAIVRWG